MSNSEEFENITKQKLNFFEKFTEIIGWLQIIASPFLLSGLIGFIFYDTNPNTNRLIIAIGITTVGLISGIIWATKIMNKRGTINFVSRISATPELDKIES